MTRSRADDYEAKRQLILDAAAKLFAQNGFPHSAIIDIARKCRSSKSVIYHYFKSKEDILFFLLHEYCCFTLANSKTNDMELAPEARLTAFIRAYIERPSSMRHRHVALVNDLKYLSPKHRTQIVALEREMVGNVVGLFSLMPGGADLDQIVLKTYVLFLFGTLNGADLWYRPSGPLPPGEMASMISGLYQSAVAAALPLAERPADPGPRAAGLAASHVP